MTRECQTDCEWTFSRVFSTILDDVDWGSTISPSKGGRTPADKPQTDKDSSTCHPLT